MTPTRTPWPVIAAWLSPTDRRRAGAVALLSGLCAAASGTALPAVLAIALLGGLCTCLALIDSRHFLLPDRLSLPLIPLALLAIGPDPATLASRGLAAAALWAGMSLFAALARRAKGQTAFGQGDVKLIAISGLWLPGDQLAPFVLCAALSAIALHAIRLARRSARPDRRIAFGAQLAPVLLAFVLLQPALGA